MGEIIATSANQMVLPKFRRGTKMLYYIHQTPLSSSSVEGGGGGGLRMRLECTQTDIHHVDAPSITLIDPRSNNHTRSSPLLH